jgi:hypothetical protein
MKNEQINLWGLKVIKNRRIEDPKRTRGNKRIPKISPKRERRELF